MQSQELLDPKVYFILQHCQGVCHPPQSRLAPSFPRLQQNSHNHFGILQQEDQILPKTFNFVMSFNNRGKSSKIPQQIPSPALYRYKNPPARRYVYVVSLRMTVTFITCFPSLQVTDRLRLNAEDYSSQRNI